MGNFNTSDLYSLDIPTSVWGMKTYLDGKYITHQFLDHVVFKLDNIEYWEDVHARRVHFVEKTGREDHVLVRYTTKFGSVDFVVDEDSLIPVLSSEKEIICVCDPQLTLSLAGCVCGAVKRERERKKNKT